MEAGQSDIRNKVLAPVFKKMGIIEQWGNGLRLIAGELHNYPEIGFEWKEPSMSFRLSFLKKNVITDMSEKTSEKILELITTNKHITIKELSENIGVSNRSIERNIKKLQEENKLKRVGADKGGYWEIIK